MKCVVQITERGLNGVQMVKLEIFYIIYLVKDKEINNTKLDVIIVGDVPMVF